jgi:hypothetical protein
MMLENAGRLVEPHHQSKPICDPRERRHFERVGADLDPAKAFPQPTIETMHAWGRLYRRLLGTLSVEDIDARVEQENRAADDELRVESRP